MLTVEKTSSSRRPISKPHCANACGKPSMPAPRIVFARLNVLERIVALPPPSNPTERRSTRFSLSIEKVMAVAVALITREVFVQVSSGPGLQS